MMQVLEEIRKITPIQRDFNEEIVKILHESTKSKVEYVLTLKED